MRPPKTICWMVLITMVPQLTACTTTRTLTPLSLSGDPARADPSRIVTVTKTDGTSMTLHGPWMDSVMVGGFVPWGWQDEPVLVQIPRTEINTIQETRADGVKTAFLLVVLFGAAATVFLFGVAAGVMGEVLEAGR